MGFYFVTGLSSCGSKLHKLRFKQVLVDVSRSKTFDGRPETKNNLGANYLTLPGQQYVQFITKRLQRFRHGGLHLQSSMALIWLQLHAVLKKRNKHQSFTCTIVHGQRVNRLDKNHVTATLKQLIKLMTSQQRIRTCASHCAQSRDLVSLSQFVTYQVDQSRIVMSFFLNIHRDYSWPGNDCVIRHRLIYSR